MNPRVIRLIGGAGTGKTRHLLDSMCDLRDRLGLSPSQIGFATFTRAGKFEMAQRAADAWSCPIESLTKEGYFRTVHSTAMKQLKIKKDEVLGEGRKKDNWIAEILGFAAAGSEDADSIPLSEHDKDAAMALWLWDYSRVTCRPVLEVYREFLELGEPVPPLAVLVSIVNQYESAKRLHGKSDFSDLVARFAGRLFTVEGVSMVEPEGELPEGVRAYFFDECQDSSALVDAACRRLASGPGVEHVVLAGDPYQSLFESFGGGSASHYLAWEAEEIIMPQSYRCPEKIMRLGEMCLQEMRHGYRDRGIKPADHPGDIHYSGDILDALEDHVTPQVSTLIIARCSYTLSDYARNLRASGVPFSMLDDEPTNEGRGFEALYKLSRGEAICATEFSDAVPLIRAKDSEGRPLLREHAKHDWDRGAMSNVDIVLPNERFVVFAGGTPALWSAIQSGDWIASLKTSHQVKASLWEQSAERWGPELASEPKIRLGTIHSAKGQEADVVLLSTQSTRRVERGRVTSSLKHDEECRVAYVGVTRARKDLVVLDDGTRYRLTLPQGSLNL